MAAYLEKKPVIREYEKKLRTLKGRSGAVTGCVKLTDKQSKFVSEYIRTRDTEQSALFANYKAKTAARMGAENLQKPEIARLVREGLQAVKNEEIWDRRKKLKLIQFGITETIKHIKKGEIKAVSILTHAIRVHNEMTGDIAPEKHLIKIEDMTIEELTSAINIIDHPADT